MEEFFLKVIDGLDDVDLAYRGTKRANDSERRENYFLLISKIKDEKGNTVNVPVYINEHAKENRTYIDANKISTVFGRDNFEEYIKRQIREKNLVRIKNKSIKTSEANALIAEDYGRDASKIKITQNEEKSSLGTKFYLKEDVVDSAGHTLTEGQSGYFEESKVRNKNGNLKIMYHGSPAQFTVFDRKKAKSSGYYGRGFYFTESASHAGQYGSQYEVYLNIKNPIQAGTKNITKQQLKKLVEELAENEDYGIENYGYDATVKSVTDSVYGKEDFAMLQDLDAVCVGDMVETIKMFNEVNGTDYDGIIAPTETVAFYPNQIKKTDNQNPTENEDIRFSLREDYDALEERYRNTLRENDTYKQVIDALESKLNIQKGISISKDNIDKVADILYKRYKSTYDKADFADKVAGLFQSGETNKGNFLYIAEQIMRPVIENSKNNLEITDYAKGILRDIRKTTIKVNGMQRNEAAYHYGTFRLLKAMNEENEKKTKEYLAWYDEQYQAKIAEGKTDKDAKSALKSSITSQYKEIYQNSTNAEKIKIKQLLLKISVNGKQLYKDYDWSSWDKKTEE